MFYTSFKKYFWSENYVRKILLELQLKPSQYLSIGHLHVFTKHNNGILHSFEDAHTWLIPLAVKFETNIPIYEWSDVFRNVNHFLLKLVSAKKL